MPLRYACFISYRSYEDNELAEALVNGLYKALKNELDPLVGPNRVFRDNRSSLAPGSLLPASLSLNICESACMVVVYGPDYFNKDNTWCTREFKAMLDLEERRLEKLAAGEQVNGLLIIIVFRGRDSLPEVFLSNRLVSFFDKYALYEPEITKHPILYPEIMKIAAYIAARFNALRGLASDPSANCQSFCLPSEIEALQWLDQISASTGTTIQQEPAFPR